MAAVGEKETCYVLRSEGRTLKLTSFLDFKLIICFHLQGGREVADFVSFLEKNASSKLKKTEL